MGRVVEISDDNPGVLDPEMPIVTALGLCCYVGQLLPFCLSQFVLYLYFLQTNES